LNLTEAPLNGTREIMDIPVELRSFTSGALTTNTNNSFAYLDSYGPIITIKNIPGPVLLEKLLHMVIKQIVLFSTLLRNK